MTLDQLHSLLDAAERTRDRYGHLLSDLEPDQAESFWLVWADMEGVLNRLVGAYMDRMAESDKLRRELAELRVRHERLVRTLGKSGYTRDGFDRAWLKERARKESSSEPATLPGGALW